MNARMLLLYVTCYLQDLVYSVSMEIDAGGDLGAKDAYLTNGES